MGRDVVDVVVVGSLNVDLVARTPRHASPGETVLASDYHEYAGGKGLNQAVAAARAGAAVAFVGAVGDDPSGTRLADVVRSEGIDDTWLTRVDDAPTGRALITVDDDAENSIVVVSGANGTVRWPEADGPSAPVVLAQLEIPARTVETAFADACASGAITILNPAPAQPLRPELLEACSLIVPNEHELAQLGGSPALLAAGVDTVVTTLGARGVRVETPDTAFTLPAVEVTPVDTTGAGDAFCGNLAARLALGDELDAALTWALAAAALATTVAGAVPSLPTSSAVETLLNA